MVQDHMTIVFILCFIISAAIPIGAIILHIKKTSSSSWLAPVFLSVAVNILFIAVAESLLRGIFSMLGYALYSQTGLNIFTDGSILGILIPSVISGICFSVGVYAAFKIFKKYFKSENDAITFGLGFGAFEFLLTAAIGFLSNAEISMAISAQGIDALLEGLPEESIEGARLAYEAVANTSVFDCAVIIFEQCSMFVLNTALSYLIYHGIKNKKRVCIFSALAIRALANIPVALYSSGVIGTVILSEALIAFAAAIAVVVTSRMTEKTIRQK